MDLSDQLINIESDVTYGLGDELDKVIKEIQMKLKCSVDAIGTIINDGELRPVYQKFRHDVESVLTNEAKGCLEIKHRLVKLA